MRKIILRNSATSCSTLSLSGSHQLSRHHFPLSLSFTQNYSWVGEGHGVGLAPSSVWVVVPLARGWASPSIPLGRTLQPGPPCPPCLWPSAAIFLGPRLLSPIPRDVGLWHQGSCRGGKGISCPSACSNRLTRAISTRAPGPRHIPLPIAS